MSKCFNIQKEYQRQNLSRFKERCDSFTCHVEEFQNFITANPSTPMRISEKLSFFHASFILQEIDQHHLERGSHSDGGFPRHLIVFGTLLDFFGNLKN